MAKVTIQIRKETDNLGNTFYSVYENELYRKAFFYNNSMQGEYALQRAKSFIEQLKTPVPPEIVYTEEFETI